MRSSERLLLLAVGVLLHACSSHSLNDSTVYYLSLPDREVCDGVDRSVAELGVVVRDEAGDPFPNVPVFLGHADPRPGEFQRVEAAPTDSNGRAILKAGREGHYLLTTGFVGFVPEVRQIYLSYGCRVEMSIELRVGAVRDVVATSGKQ